MAASDNGALVSIKYEDRLDKVFEKLKEKAVTLTVEFLAYTGMVALTTRNPLFRHESGISLTDPKIGALYHFVILEIICKTFEHKSMTVIPGVSCDNRPDMKLMMRRIKKSSEKHIDSIKAYCEKVGAEFPNFEAMYFQQTVRTASEPSGEEHSLLPAHRGFEDAQFNSFQNEIDFLGQHPTEEVGIGLDVAGSSPLGNLSSGGSEDEDAEDGVRSNSEEGNSNAGSEDASDDEETTNHQRTYSYDL